MKPGVGNLAALIVLTAGSAAVMATISMGMQWPAFMFPAEKQKPSIAIPDTLVTVMEATPQNVEIIATYTGMIRPFERHTLAFEISGRIENLGTDSDSTPVDQGDTVTAGQVLARLDDRLLSAQLKEAKARLEQAQTNMNRAQDLRAKGQRMITDADFQNYVTQLQLAEAAFTISEKRHTEATLVSPVNGKIAKRAANVGESVNMHQMLFQVIEVDRVLLVVGVPESNINEILLGQPARIELLASDRLGQKLSCDAGAVYRIGETADDKTGLFEVEVLIDNRNAKLRPGLVATAQIAVAKLNAFILPMDCAVHRDGKLQVFSVGEDELAHSYELSRWIEQGSHIVVPDLPADHRRIVIRGQHRLVDGRAVDVTLEDSLADAPDPGEVKIISGQSGG